jgi:hypothetical protein
LPHYIHVIRLRGPWQLEPLERYVQHQNGRFDRSTSGLPLSGRATMPADWSNLFGRDYFGRVSYRRLFQRLSGLESGERAFLVVEPPRSRGVLSLNGKTLGEVVWGGPPARFDVTDLLADPNRLEIVVEHPVLDGTALADDDDFSQSPGGLVGEVRLEIEE